MTAVSPRPIAALLEDAGADVLLEALGALGCEYHIEPQRPARSLRWTRTKPDPCPRTVSVRAAEGTPGLSSRSRNFAQACGVRERSVEAGALRGCR